jgi:hypothetical protein
MQSAIEANLKEAESDYLTIAVANAAKKKR